MRLEFSTSITAADEKTRTIIGQIVPFGVSGSTSLGPVIFQEGSLHIGDNVKVLLEHDNRRPVGKLVSTSANPAGIMGEMKISNTSAGSDVLVEAADGLRDGISVGANIIEHTVKGSTIIVHSAELVEVSLVTSPAFDAARVTQVAASADDETETIEEIEMTETPIEVIEEVSEVEASKVNASAYGTPIFTAPRSPINDGASYLEHSIKAARGNDESRQYVMAADDSFSTNPGFNPVEYLGQVVGSPQRKFGRPTIEACGGATAHQFIGNTVSVAKVGTVPTVASTSEGGAPSETGMTSSFISGTATKYAGLNRLSVELLDLQGTPAFYQSLIDEMAAAYAKATNAAVVAAIVAGGTQATNQTADADGIIAYVATETPAAYAASGEFPMAYVGGASQWALMLGATDTTGRPIFNAYQPQNAGGQVGPGAARGSVLGLDLYVDNAMVNTTIDDSAFIICPDSIAIFEQAPRMIQVNQLGSLEVEVSMHGYLATIIKRAGGLRRFAIA